MKSLSRGIDCDLSSRSEIQYYRSCWFCVRDFCYSMNFKYISGLINLFSFAQILISCKNSLELVCFTTEDVQGHWIPTVPQNLESLRLGKSKEPLSLFFELLQNFPAYCSLANYERSWVLFIEDDSLSRVSSSKFSLVSSKFVEVLAFA